MKSLRNEKPGSINSMHSVKAPIARKTIKPRISMLRSKVYTMLPNNVKRHNHERKIIKIRNIEKGKRSNISSCFIDNKYEIKHPARLVRLDIETTNICNANCLFCNYKYQKRKHGVMSMEIFEKILKQASNMGVKRLTLVPIVGEPLLDRFLIERLKLMQDYKFPIVDMTTNGILLGREEVYKYLCDGLMSKVNISLCEFDEEIYEKMYDCKSYKQLLHGITLLLKYHKEVRSNLKIVINLRPLTKNYKEVLKSNDYVKYVRPYIDGNKVKLCIVPAYDNRVDSVKQEGLLKQVEFYSGLKNKKGKKIRPCCKLFYGIVTYEGAYMACACALDSGKNSELYLGEIAQETLCDMYNSNKLKKIRESFVQGDCPAICSECSVYR